MKKLLLSILLFSVLVPNRWAADTEPLAPFLKLTGSSRQSALGGAYAGAWADSDTVTINPAGLYGIEGVNGHLTYFSLYEGFNYISGFVGNSFEFGTLGINFAHFSSGSEEGTVFNSSGDLVKSGESISAAGNAISVTYANTFLWGIATGASIKLVQENFSNPPLTMVAADIGASKRFLQDRLVLGASLMNIGPGKKRADDSGITDQLPIFGRIGAGFVAFRRKNHEVTLFTDMTATKAENIGFHVGAEYNVFRYVFLRGGYEPTSLAEKMSLGAGFRYGYKKWTYALDYALRTNSDFGTSNKFTLKAVYNYDVTPEKTLRKRTKRKRQIKFGLANVPLSWDQVLRMVSAGSEDYVRVITKDGDELVGQVSSVLPDEMEIITDDGERKAIPKDNIIIMFKVLNSEQ